MLTFTIAEYYVIRTLDRSTNGPVCRSRSSVRDLIACLMQFSGQRYTALPMPSMNTAFK